MNEINLLKVARALREASGPGFTMRRIHSCGTPGCALGHYASRADLQNEFALGPGRLLQSRVGKRDFEFVDCNCGTCAHHGLCYNGPVVREHFGIDVGEAQELFGSHGCGDAGTREQAAAYIERFVEERRRLKALTPKSEEVPA